MNQLYIDIAGRLVINAGYFTYVQSTLVYGHLYLCIENPQTQSVPLYRYDPKCIDSLKKKAPNPK